MKKLSVFLLGILLFFIFLGLTGCWWDDDDDVSYGGGGGVSNPKLGGDVVDGYVKGATVEVYSDKEMKTLIGSTTSDANGHFEVTLNVNALPDAVFIKTEGGIDVDTNLPAPSLKFAAPKEKVDELKNGDLKITHFTTKICEGILSTLTDETKFDVAYQEQVTEVKDQLGIDSEEVLFSDPKKNDTLAEVQKELLATEPPKMTLQDGDYILTFVGFDAPHLLSKNDDGSYKKYDSIGELLADNDVFVQFKIRIRKGKISALAPEGAFLTGEVVGSSFVIYEVESEEGETEVFRISGHLGYLGGFSGFYSDVVEDANKNVQLMGTGLCVGSLIPYRDDFDFEGVRNSIKDALEGKHLATLRSAYSNVEADSGRPVVWTKFTAETINFDSNTFKLSNLNTAETNIVFQTFTEESKCLTREGGQFIEMKILKTAPNLNNRIYFTVQTNIVFARYKMTDGETIFIVFPTDTNRGIYVAQSSDGIDDIGDIIIEKDSETLKPFIKSKMTYEVATVFARASLLGMPRANLDDTIQTSELVVPDLTKKDWELLTKENNGSTEVEELRVFNRDNLVFFRDDDGIFNDNSTDYINFYKVAMDGSFWGIRTKGDEVFPDEEGILENKPLLITGKMIEKGKTTPSYTGKLKFLARTLYTHNDVDTELEDFMSYVAGEINITSSASATLTYQEGNTSHTVSLAVKNVKGVLHIYGALSDEDYIDIMWPIGSSTAIYYCSEAEDKNVDELGVVYIEF